MKAGGGAADIDANVGFLAWDTEGTATVCDATKCV